jgi:glycosyltransferase involved in cell wall biosynthesis
VVSRADIGFETYNRRVSAAHTIVDVVIPTRNRPAKLERCLAALASARGTHAFEAHVLDSSAPEHADAVREVCARFAFARLHRHSGAGYAAARNACARAGSAPLVVSVDDDVYVHPDAVTRLVERYCAGSGWRVVAGSVSWGGEGSGPVRIRRIGYGTRARDEGEADFYVTALLLYPRELVLQFPYNERVTSGEDKFMGALWRSKGVRMLWEPGATAMHDEEHSSYATAEYETHIYVNLFDALMVRRSIGLACSFEFLGFAAGVRSHTGPAPLRAYTAAWWRGNARFLADRRRLAEIASRRLVGDAPACP